jgi:hypothetical protein
MTQKKPKQPKKRPEPPMKRPEPAMKRPEPAMKRPEPAMKRPEPPTPMRDFHFLTLVDLANKLDVGLGVTIVAAGAVITGELISRRAYFKAFGESFGQLFESRNPEAAEDLRREFADLGEEIHGETAEDDKSLPSFYHLRGAQVFAGDKMVPTNGMLWRGKISEVAGFSFGRFSQSR